MTSVARVTGEDDPDKTTGEQPLREGVVQYQTPYRHRGGEGGVTLGTKPKPSPVNCYYDEEQA